MQKIRLNLERIFLQKKLNFFAQSSNNFNVVEEKIENNTFKKLSIVLPNFESTLKNYKYIISYWYDFDTDNNVKKHFIEFI